MTPPVIGSVAASFSLSFWGTSSSLIFSRPVKLKTRDNLQKKILALV